MAALCGRRARWTLHYGTRRALVGRAILVASAHLPAGQAGSAAAFVFAALLLALYLDAAVMAAWWARPLISAGRCATACLVHELIVKAVAASPGPWQSAVATLAIVVPVSLAMSIFAGALSYQAIDAGS
jgi:hypothetical protein